MTALTGVTVMLRLILRLDRIRLPIWLLALIGTVFVSAPAVKSTYGTPAAIASYEDSVGSSAAAIAINGPPVALDTIGGIMVYETSVTMLVGTALMAIFLVVRHTRGDEEAGRTELLSAGVLGRHAATAATAIVVTAASAVVGLGCTAAFLSADLPLSGSLLFGAAVAALGWVFATVALVAAQVTEHARGAIGLALAALGVSFAIRAIGDVTDSWVSMLSPLGWSQAVHAFGGERWWPLALSVVAGGGLLLVAGRLLSHRDLGAGLVAPRPGPAQARPALSRPVLFALRLQRASLIGWTVGLALLGVVYGSFGDEVQELVSGNPDLEEFFQRTGGASLVDAYFATILLINALIATGFTIASVLRLRSEEVAFRVEPLLATRLSRAGWSLGGLTVASAGTALLLGAAGLGTGLTHAVVSGDAGAGWKLLLSSFAYLPAALVLGGIAFALIGWLPNLIMATWAVLAVSFVIAWFGDLLSLPQWLVDVSPFSHVPQVPMAAMTWTPVLGLTLIAVGLTALGLVGLRRRDIG